MSQRAAPSLGVCGPDGPSHGVAAGQRRRTVSAVKVALLTGGQGGQPRQCSRFTALSAPAGPSRHGHHSAGAPFPHRNSGRTEQAFLTAPRLPGASNPVWKKGRVVSHGARCHLPPAWDRKVPLALWPAGWVLGHVPQCDPGPMVGSILPVALRSR